MDNAVAIVQAYLRVNGYLTVTEYPIVEVADNGGFQTATDLDILAFRFAHSCTLHASLGSDGSGAQCEIETDPALDVRAGIPDMIIGEVKEGRAVLNRAASKPGVVAAALTRFGCCDPTHAVELAQRLARDGQARTRHGHRIRLMAFGSLPPEASSRRFAVVLLGSVVDYLRQHIHRHWSQIQTSESKDPGLSMLMMLEKAERGRAAPATAQSLASRKGDRS